MAERKQTVIDGTTTTYWVYGETPSDQSGDESCANSAGTPTIVLVHGFRGTHEGLDLIAKGLAPDLRVISPDLPGFGQSESLAAGNTIDAYATWLRRFTAAIGLSEAPVLGHSFGSIVVCAAVAAGLRPSRVVLINPISQPALQGPQRLGSLAALGYYRLTALLPEGAARRVLSMRLVVRVMSEIMAKTHDPRLRAWIHAQHQAYFSVFDSPSGLLEAFHTSITHDTGEYADALTMPVLVIAGDRDDIVPLTSQRAFVEALPNARLEVVEGVGHLVHYEAWRQADSWVRPFVCAPA
ncbi:alpha/beta fold hydrolase [Pseudoclavibacter sp. CFCC 13611]|uniref:alpha/beta fold hydrolase n=1 Tax=Pseudoclavibacter sp. CFCC 13611 TaxID=2615178 RepID=UPI001300D7DC|nr:alpha/beta hydrolase [Pseudoclavibacter sp. CFCC 13611]KAB1663499.1 alpha/beta hydrolase [Pseudoclavibacter sp. CFCC 13611]